MFFEIDPAGDVPIYEQIVRQVKFAIAAGTLRAGQRLPSVRQLATDLAVNPNTVARAIQQLQIEGIADPLRGRGMVVCVGAAAKCRRERKALLSQQIEAVLAEALRAGLSVEDIESLVAKKLRRLDGNVEVAGTPP